MLQISSGSTHEGTKMEYINVEGGAPIKSWADDAEEGALEQATNLARLPFVIDHIALMPDAHQGYGMPIGGVLFADKAVVPYAVGVDIGCGVQLIETEMLNAELGQDEVDAFLHQISRDVPTGNGPQGQHKYSEGEPFDSNKLSSMFPIAESAVYAADSQLGTLGCGNHFLELQQDSDGNVCFMLHSGSRSVGKKICDYWHKIALALNEKYHSVLPHKELAYLPFDSEEGHDYFQEMEIAMKWAEENRRRMAGKVISAFGEIWGAKAWPVVDVHHNYAAWENHYGKNGIVHRKGAVRAQLGETVLIPGSMGTSSWIAEGLGNRESFNTCQHGAGRLRSRGATRKLTTVEEMDAQLESVGVTLVTRKREDVIDESAIAYKDIDAVMAASTDLIKPIKQLFPVGVIKG
jgi:tRNA-splicing ligase RtcB